MNPEPYRTRVQTIAGNAAIAVMNGDADDLAAALADVDSPALRADAEWLAEQVLQDLVEKRAELARASA